MIALHKFFIRVIGLRINLIKTESLFPAECAIRLFICFPGLFFFLIKIPDLIALYNQALRKPCNIDPNKRSKKKHKKFLQSHTN